ncbi:MAG: hypothetical protein JXA57_02695, partial [Armatimonadetes bacterium]|nr:hypothetical protein [Armatimonadota bacterium]
MGTRRAPWRLLGVIGMAVLFAGAGGGWLLAAERTESVAGTGPSAMDMIEVEEPFAEELSETERVPEETPQLPVVPEALSTGGVELVSPEPGATLRGTALLKVTWANPTGYVVFRIDDKFAYATTAPFEMRWDTSSAVDGQHVIAVDAYDASARYAGGASVSVVVENTVPTPP